MNLMVVHFAPGDLFLEGSDNFSDPKKLFHVCCVCIQDVRFNNFENDTVKVYVDEEKLTVL